MRHLSKSGIVTLQALGGPIGSKTVTEKWEGDAEVKKTGEHAGKSVEQLKSELEGLKAKSKTYQDKNQPVPDAIKDQEHEIMFAIRAKQGWKKGEGAMGENVNEGVSPKDMDKIKAAVEAATSFMNVGAHLKQAGLRYTFATSPMAIYIVQPTPNNKVAIVNKKYASQPDFVHGEIAVGIMESVNENTINEGKKSFKVNPGIGNSKYSISSHDGVKKHKDGSDFYDIKIFKNKVDLEKGIKDYKSKGFVEEGIENVANGLPQTMGKQKSLKREALKSIVKEVMQEEAEYQQFFQKVLDKAGKSIPSMSDDEKKAFFNKVDAAWKAKQESKVVEASKKKW